MDHSTVGAGSEPSGVSRAHVRAQIEEHRRAYGLPRDASGRAPRPQAGAPAAAGVGLSLGTNLTGRQVKRGDFLVEVRKGGSLLQAQPMRGLPGVEPRPQVGGGVRKECTEFSRKSRNNMLRRMSEMSRHELSKALFLTLTYPAKFPTATESKVHLDRFLKRLLRRYKGCGVIWKLEAQERGAPHYHLIVLGVSYIDYRWLGQAWYECCDRICPEHLEAGTEVRRVKSHRQALAYVTKYVAKVVQLPEAYAEAWKGAGRYWGSCGAWREYLAPLVRKYVTRAQVARLARVMDGRRLARARQRRKGRAAAVGRARRRRDLTYSRFWYGDPDEVLQRLAEVVGGVL